jgi:15-hydroxyprostaglandin dehydrogenase (NAD)
MDAFLADDTLTGQAVELSQENIYFRAQPDWPNESQRWIGEESNKIWDEGYAVGKEPLERCGY